MALTIENELQRPVKISLDFYNNNLITINAKRLDTLSRYVNICCTDHGKKVVLDKNTITAFVRYKKPDNVYCYNDVEILDDGTLLLELTQQMLAVNGKSFVDIVLISDASIKIENLYEINTIYDLDASVLSTMTFEINTLPTPTDDAEIESVYEYDALLNCLSRAIYTEKHLKALDNTLNSNEKARDDAEKLRQTNTATAIKNCETATVNANTATSKANTATNNANTAASNANAATQNAISATNNANEATEKANTATANANKATTDANTATSKANTATSNANTATANAVVATTNANNAANNANSIAQAIQTKVDNGDFSATVQVGTVTTGNPGTSAKVSNSGTNKDVILNFTIPRGDTGAIENINESTVDFSQATTRTNIVSGEQFTVLFGKIQKWLSDLKDGAFQNVANNLTTTSSGYVLDARQGKIIKDDIDAMIAGDVTQSDIDSMFE